MKFVITRNYLQSIVILAILVVVSGCATGVKPAPNETVIKDTPAVASPSGKAATVTITPSGTGTFIIQGNNADDISGFDLVLNYDSTSLSSPTVTKNSDNSGAMMESNATVPGTIRLVMISTKPFSGTVPLATVSFATVKGQGELTIKSVNMVNSKGVLVK